MIYLDVFLIFKKVTVTENLRSCIVVVFYITCFKGTNEILDVGTGKLRTVEIHHHLISQTSAIRLLQ